MARRPDRGILTTLLISGLTVGLLFLLRSLTHPTEPGTPSPVVPPPGEAAMGEFTDCGDCHSDLDEGSGGGETQLLTFAHETHFATDVSECSWCHPANSHDGNQVNAPTMGRCFTCHLGESQPRSCTVCHPEQHPDRGDCSTCHDLKSWESGFVHAPELAAAHARSPCEACHTPANDGRVGFPAGCVDCHEPQHPMKLGALDLERCAECHTIARWYPTTFHHPATGCIECHGDHHDDPQRSECQLCHSQRTWADPTHPDSNCTACHDRGELHSGLSNRCQNCHIPGAYWEPSTYQHPQVGEHVPTGTPPLKCFKCHTTTYAEASCKCHDHEDR